MGEVLELTWPLKEGGLVEVQTIKKFVPEKHKGGDDAEKYFSMGDDLEEEEDEVYEYLPIEDEIEDEEFAIIAMSKFNGNKFGGKYKNVEFEGAACGCNMVKGVFTDKEGKKTNITFYNTRAIFNYGYPKVPAQAVTVKFKGEKEEANLFVKVIKVDNPNFEYFVLGCENYAGTEAPEGDMLDQLEKRPKYTGIVDKDGNLWLRKNYNSF